jgi:hypothetical protein
MPICYQQNQKKNVLNYGLHREIDICSCDDCGFARYVCNDCKRFHKNLRDFKQVQCLIKNLLGHHDHECDYLQCNILYLEDGSPDDEYYYFQNHGLYLEHDASPDDNFVDEATLSVVKIDDNYCAMAKAAESNDIIEKTAWGNESSMNYFLMENQNEHAGIQSVVSNATKHNELTSSDIDYHLLGTYLCNNLPHKKIRLLESFLNETLTRAQQKKTLILSHRDIRRCYTKGRMSIYMKMPVPLATVGGEAFGNFAIVSVENAVNYLLGHGIPLKTLKLNKARDWKNSNESFHTKYHKELYKKLQKLEHIPENLRIHLLYIWSDGFQKNTLVKTKKTSLQLFTVYAVPPDGERDIARYTIPFALGKKRRDHQPQLIEILRQTKELEKVTTRFCKDSNSCEPTWFERVVIQND